MFKKNIPPKQIQIKAKIYLCMSKGKSFIEGIRVELEKTLSVLSNESNQFDCFSLFPLADDPEDRKPRAAAMREKIKTINFHYYLHTIYIKMHVILPISRIANLQESRPAI